MVVMERDPAHDVIISSEALLSTTALKERGLRPRRGEVPAAVETWQYRSRSGTRHLWRLDQAVAVKLHKLVPSVLYPTPANVLRAVWSINRAATEPVNDYETAEVLD